MQRVHSRAFPSKTTYRKDPEPDSDQKGLLLADVYI